MMKIILPTTKLERQSSHNSGNSKYSISTAVLIAISALTYGAMATGDWLRAAKEAKERVNYSIPPQVRDVNGDGRADLILTKYDGNQTAIFGQEDGSFTFTDPIGGRN
jgi:hypothetical protein